MHCEVRLVADALRITLCARERYMVATGDRVHAPFKSERKGIYSALKATKARGKECITIFY